MAIGCFSPRWCAARTDDATDNNGTAPSQPSARAFRFRNLSLDVLEEDDEDVVMRQYDLVRPKAMFRKVATMVGHFGTRVSSSLRRPSPYEVNKMIELDA